VASRIYIYETDTPGNNGADHRGTRDPEPENRKKEKELRKTEPGLS
jgi:hypothetical protein